jgi:hypothetical protein
MMPYNRGAAQLQRTKTGDWSHRIAENWEKRILSGRVVEKKGRRVSEKEKGRRISAVVIFIAFQKQRS